MKILLSLLTLVWAAGSAHAWEFKVTEESKHPSGAVYRQIECVNGDETVRLYGVFFSDKTLTLQVEDHPAGSPENLEAVIRRTGAIAGINASYFHPDMTPLGLVVARGKVIHEQQAAGLLSGILADNGERLFLLRRKEFKLGPKTREAVQAGPFLVDDSKVVANLNPLRNARRTAVASLGKDRWALISTSGVSLAECGDLLAAFSIPDEKKITRALNLDGGSSTAFWFDRPGRPVTVTGFATVRNHLVLVPRQP